MVLSSKERDNRPRSAALETSLQIVIANLTKRTANQIAKMWQTSRLQSVTSTDRHYERQSAAAAASEIPLVQITAPPPVALKAELGRAQTSTRSTIELFSTPVELQA
jgi:hypothetical protein